MSILLQYPAIKELIADEIVKGLNEDRWDRFIQLSRTPERKYRAKMREVFSQQLDEIMQNLAGFKSVKALEDSLVDFDKYRIQYVEFEQLMLPGILSGWAELELEALEVGISFNVLDPNVQIAVFNRANHFSDSVINETRDLLHRVINESAQAGEGIPQLEKRIRALYDSMTKYRAVRIARTETIWAQNEGAEQSYLQSGVIEEKEWWTARDERRCFAKNTLVETSEGEKFIQNIKVGDMVKTHLGFKRVTKVMVNKRRGKMLKMKFESGTHLICTPDHPIYEASKGWQYAEELNVGDELQTSQNEIIKITDIGYIKFFKAYDNIAKFFKTIIPSCVLNRIIMPILTITFKADIKGGQKEVNAGFTDLKFLDKFYLKPFKRLSNIFFKSSFPRIRTKTIERAKSSDFFLRRHNTKFFSTIQTINENRGASALLRTINSCIPLCIKYFSACRAYSNGFEFMTTSQATNSISVSSLFWNNKIFVTDRAMLGNHNGFLESSVTSIRTKSGIAFDFALGLIRRFTAIFTNNFSTFFHIINLHRYYNIFVNWCQLYNVYNIEVEDSHTYYAEGILVHNCDWCAEMHGKRMAVGDDYFGLGSSMVLADGRSMTFNYENVSHPPLHPHCRCCLLPVVELTRQYLGYLAYKWLML